MYASSDKGCSRIIVITRTQIVFEIIISYFVKIDKSAKYDRFFYNPEVNRAGCVFKTFFR